MKLDEYAKYDGLGLAELVRNGEVSAADLAATARLGIEKVNPTINAVIGITNHVEIAFGLFLSPFI